LFEPRITSEAIQQARTRIRAEFLNSRLQEDGALSQAVGARLFCKIETENAVGSFKGRGADAFVNELVCSPGEKTIIVASAGNFGLAMAYAAKSHGVNLTVYAAKTASQRKLDQIRAAGESVVLVGRDFDDAKDHARAAAATIANAIYVEDGREPAITEGAGTMGMELTSQPESIHTLLVPLGNGALLAGLGCWFRTHSPQTRVIGICAEGAPAMAYSWRTRRLQCTTDVDTIADGIAVRVPVPEALSDLEEVVDDILLVSEESIRRALRLIHKHLGLIAEPSGAVGVAALLSHPELRVGTVCTPITGGNLTEEQLRTWINE
jgi:threonine dehydratase